MINYKNLYIKYKKKYLKAKKIYGGNNEINVEQLYKNELEKLVNLKKKYETNFQNGLEQKKIFDFLKEIQKMGKNIEKIGYSLNDQINFLEMKYPMLNNDMENLNNILLFQIINEYLNNISNNSLEDLVKYLKNNIPLKNNELCKYKTGEILGQGSFGVVYKLPENKVLKVINATNYVLPKKKQNEFKNTLDSIIDEINAMKILNKIKPPISPKLYDYWMSNNNNSLHIYILMEFKGKSLTNWLNEKQRGLTNKEKKMIDKQIEKMHKADIAHIDLHLDNILVEEINDKVNFYISDFGLSKTKKRLFDTIKKNDYTRWREMFSEYDILNRYLELIIKILDIQIIKM